MTFVLAMVLAGLAALPLSVSAQDIEEGATSAPNLREPAPSPSSEAAPKEPALRGATGLSSSVRFSQWYWYWHDEALKIALFSYSLPSSPPSISEEDALALEFELERTELRVRRAKNNLVGFSVVFGVGAVMAGVGAGVAVSSSSYAGVGVALAGATIGFVGLIGTAVAGAKWSARKQELRELQEAHYRRPRRAQWDLAQSRLVF